MKKPFLLILISIFLLPLVVRPAIASEIWIFAIFGLGANLLLGYTGLLSFGQSTFFGSAAYVAGWMMKARHQRLPRARRGHRRGRALGCCGRLPSVQRSGLYFIMLTFALNQLFYFTAYSGPASPAARTACRACRGRR
jgi:branched-chain amino acid transport system permease protein